MKKGFLLLVLTALCMMGFAQQAEPQWTNVLNEKPEAFRIQLVSSSENSIKVNVQVPGFYATTVTTPKGDAQIISVPKSVSSVVRKEPPLLWRLPGKGEQGGTLQKLK